MAHLILVRHGESTWNSLGKWAGLTDVGLTNLGADEARQAALAITDIPLDIAYVSALKRAKRTLDHIKQTLNLSKDLPTIIHPALNERDYGKLTGLVKREVKQQIGDEAYRRVSRSWDEPAPGGESLRMVYDRVVNYYHHTVLANLMAGKNVVIVSHHNPLRALIKHIEDIPDAAIADVEMGTSGLYIYTIDSNGEVTSKQVRGGNDSYLH